MVGKSIRMRRKKKGMTLDELAGIVGITSGGLSQIERGLVDPSLAVLRKIVKALGVSMYQIFAEDGESFVSRHGERKKAFFSDVNVDYEFVTPRINSDDITPKMEVVMVTLNAKSWGNEGPQSHESDECFVVVKGSFDVKVDDEIIHLNELDSIYLCENVKHRLYNPTDDIVIGFSILSSAIF